MRLGVGILLAALPMCAAMKIGTFAQQVRRTYAIGDVREVAVHEGTVWARTATGAMQFTGGVWTPGAWPAGAKAAETPGAGWTPPAEGMPVGDVTSVARGPKGDLWIGTRRGAVHFDGKVWEYRQGLRWLPDDDVRSVAVDAAGTAWFATAKGVGAIELRPITLAEKARIFEQEIDKRHRRTPYGYVDSVALARPGDLAEWSQRDSDNDGLWTSMYGAGECFAWAATRDPAARRRAVAAFEALRFLGVVTQGGPHPAPKGFVARTILPVAGPDPNLSYTPERDRQTQRTRDRLWKVMDPRWPKSADGQWYWKSDTSSDELDGHYFFYANYYDLVAETEAEKRAVREHVAALTGHLVDHGFQLVDHDGKVTRWGVFNPEKLNHDPQWWEERSLNSLSMLAYLRVAEHITGERRFADAARALIDRHSYAMNVLIPKTNAGPGSGNQSDDEMAFMNFYCLLQYERDPAVRRMVGFAFHQRWQVEKQELNPLFNFLYAAAIAGVTYDDAFGRQPVGPAGAWLEESADTLRRYPLDRVNWGLSNSHRRDIALLPDFIGGSGRRGSRKDGRVLPIDERYVDKWNHDPWALDYRGDGRRLADGASFLLPYYLGLYHKFIED